MSAGRLTSRLIVSSLIRRIGQGGGTAMVLARGDDDAGGIVLVLAERGGIIGLIERGHDLDGHEAWRRVGNQVIDKKSTIADYLAGRRRSDPDLWAIELDIADCERFVAGMLALD